MKSVDPKVAIATLEAAWAKTQAFLASNLGAN